jgi:hypothetical protein
MSRHLHDWWPDVRPGVRALRIAGMVVLGIIAAAIFALVFGWLVMILWNWLMPAIFHLGELTYWQAFGIIVLAKLIFGGIGGRGPGGAKHRNPWKGNPWEGRHGEHGGRDRWQLYREYWEQEGRQAFDAFVKSKTDQKEQPAGTQTPGT